jgi:hypothetical protein
VLLAVLLAACGGTTGAPVPKLSLTPTPPLPTPTHAPSTPLPTARPLVRATPRVAGGPATSSAEASTPATPPEATTLVVKGTGSAGLRLRDTPDGKVLLVVPDGTPLAALGPRQQAAGYTWVQVRTEHGTEGWAADTYLTVAPTPTP